MNTAFLSLGSNVDAGYHIRAAIEALEMAFPGCRLSPVYRTQAVGFEGEDFINLVAAVETRRSARELKRFLRDLEDRYGRDRSRPKFSDRTLDIDILLFGDAIIHCEDLNLPRPEILRFAHVLRPLAEVAPEVVHPVLGRTLAELWAASGLQGVEMEAIEGFSERGRNSGSGKTP